MAAAKKKKGTKAEAKPKSPTGAKPIPKPATKKEGILADVEEDLKRNMRSTMFETLPEGHEHVKMEKKRDTLGAYYKKMALRCKSCEKGFDHEMHIEPIVLEVSCPECDEAHLIHFIPSSSLFAIHSSSLNLSSDKKKDEEEED